MLEFATDFWNALIAFLLVFSVLVFIHELGHYWVARWAGVRVEVFSIGFGAEIYGWTDRSATRWKVSAIPLGGYVKMFGENDFHPEDEGRPLTPEEQAVSFHHKRLGQRAAIVAAGPAANFILAIVLLTGLFSIAGEPSRPYAAVGEVLADSAAEEAGFAAGDRIVAIDGEDVVWFEDLQRVVSAQPGVTLTFEIERDGETQTLVASPKPKAVTGDSGTSEEIGVLGVSYSPEHVAFERLDPFTALWTATERTVTLTGNILSALWQIISGERTVKELGGPIRIAQLSGQMAESGVVSLVFFMAALSVNLGLINLFPIPMLDGGHLAFYAVEAVRGRPLNQRTQEYGFRFGMVLVLLLMIFATWNDIINSEWAEKLRQLIT